MKNDQKSEKKLFHRIQGTNGSTATSGKPRAEIIKEYELTPSSFDKWVHQHQDSGSFQEKDNRKPELEELVNFRKEDQKLTMENDILKQSALIIGRKQM